MILSKLVELRDAKGWTNQRLADESGVPLSTVIRICNGQTDNPTILQVEKLANALGCSIDEITGVKQVEQKFNPDDNLIQLYKDIIRTKDKYIKFLSGALISIFVIVLVMLFLDMFILDVGYIRRL